MLGGPISASPNFPKIPSDWIETSLYVPKTETFVRIFHKKNFGKGRILFAVHGFGEQSDRYEHFPFYLSEHIDVIACPDLVGHGKSGGKRGYISHFDQYVDGVESAYLPVTQMVKSKIPQIEVFWHGHSLGGLVSLRMLFRNPNLVIRAASVSSPLLRLSMPVPQLKKYFALLVEPILGQLPLKNDLDPKLVSKDTRVQSHYLENNLNHGIVTPRWFVKTSKMMAQILKTEGPMHYHLMVMSSLADGIVDYKSSYEFFSQVKIFDGFRKVIQTFPNVYHEPFNDLEKELAFNCLDQWIAQNSKI